VTQQEQIDEAVKHLDDPPVPPEDPRPFWLRLLRSLRIKVSGVPKSPKIEITGRADF